MTRRTATRLAPLLALMLAGATACSASGDEPIIESGTPPPGGSVPATIDLDSDGIVLTSALRTVDSCDALLDDIKADALDRVGPYGFNPNGPGYPIGVTPLDTPAVATDAAAAPGAERNMADASAAAAPTSGFDTVTPSPAGGEQGAGSVEQSGTNNQEVGVDEADLVKSDGQRLVVVSGNLLRVIDLTGPTPVLTRQIVLPSGTSGGELFLDGDTALLMTTGWTDRPFVGRTVPSDWYPGSPTGRLLEIDLEGGDIVRTLDFEGSYLSAREVAGTVRVVLSATADRLAFVYPSNDSALDGAEAANRDLIERSTIDQWLPTYQITEGDTVTASGPLVECDRVHLPDEFAGFGSLVLLTIDPSQGLDVIDATSVFTDAQTVYASTDVVAVATPRWATYGADGAIVGDPGAAYTTAVHTFDITDPNQARYLASGSVPGHLLNQYSLSEHNGYLRVATTAGSPWGVALPDRVGGPGATESFVTVLGRDGSSLVPVGQVGGLGQGEQIQAVRFLGDRGYVVTFRQTDPLYTLDLSDPADPQVTGELEIPGFSSYLHPIGDNLVLGVGTDGDEQGATGGTVVSLFDVGDPSHPTRTAKLAIGEGNGFDGGSWTPVSSDARAFTWWDGRAVIPVSWWRFDAAAGTQHNGSDAVVVGLDEQGQLQELGRVSHPAGRFCSAGVVPQVQPLVEQDGVSSGTGTGIVPGPQPCFDQPAEIIRSLVVGDTLFTVSSSGVAANDLASLQARAWVPFG